MKLKSELLFDYDYMTCDLRLFAHSSSSPQKIHKGVVDQFNFNFLHSISTFCTKNFNFLDCLGLIDGLSANERAEIIECILLVYQLLGTSKV